MNLSGCSGVHSPNNSLEKTDLRYDYEVNTSTIPYFSLCNQGVQSNLIMRVDFVFCHGSERVNSLGSQLQT